MAVDASTDRIPLRASAFVGAVMPVSVFSNMYNQYANVAKLELLQTLPMAVAARDGERRVEQGARNLTAALKVQAVEARELAAAARRRSEMYGFLATLINAQPDAPMVERLRNLSLQPLFDLVCGPAGSADARAGLEAIAAYQAETEGRDVDAVAQQLAADWVRLFRGLRRGIGPVPPYESLYTGDQQGTRVIGAVMRAYRRHGAVLRDDTHEQADHLGLELGFLGFLAECEAQAWDAGDETQATSLFDAGDEFLRVHPRRWAGRFCDAAAVEARTDFYRGALLLMKAVLDDG